ncbi:MAG: DpnI domain-containing protein [Patescibacteria group bacterium]|jgi:type II restriction enzyme
MKLFLDKKLAINYKSQSQIARIITESWVQQEIFCPNCGDKIESYKNNKPVADFYCKKCSDDFELKSKKGKIGKKITAGAYSKMIERLNSDQKPHFFFMGYLATLFVNDFFVVPKYFFIPEIIEKRKALTENAKRAGWVGSNILFSAIPISGKIFYIENGKEISKKEVLQKWQKTAFLEKIRRPELKGWILDIMNCIEILNKKEFLLDEIYQFEGDLRKIHPENNNIKAKIRQQLQFLRDKGYLKFIESGKYRLI